MTTGGPLNRWLPRNRAGALTAVATALVVNGVICAVAKPLAPDFSLLTQPVVLFWTAVGGTGIVLVHRQLEQRTHHPLGWLLAACAAALILTVLPDVGMLLWRAPWFGPYTAQAVWVLILLHATCAVSVLAMGPLWIGGPRKP